VSFDVDSISSKYMPGVSAPSVVGGLTSEEALEIVEIAGLCSKVRLVDFSEFNPAVESVLSSSLLVELFFSLCMNYALRK
jgi:formiminoglutamase